MGRPITHFQYTHRSSYPLIQIVYFYRGYLTPLQVQIKPKWDINNPKIKRTLIKKLQEVNEMAQHEEDDQPSGSIGSVDEGLEPKAEEDNEIFDNEGDLINKLMRLKFERDNEQQ
jgi:hypothetical protein